jgi:hypothetical protein
MDSDGATYASKKREGSNKEKNKMIMSCVNLSVEIVQRFTLSVKHFAPWIMSSINDVRRVLFCFNFRFWSTTSMTCSFIKLKS